MTDDLPRELTRDLIVIGGSAGGVEALTLLVAGLPPGLPAAICVVMHRPAYLRSMLSEILSRAGPLRARDAVHGMPLERGVIHVAVPDYHLLIERAPHGSPNENWLDGSPGKLRLARGPKENRARPSVDPLFRSAALAFGPRVIGVVLSGALDDGTAGLWAIRDQGGLAVVHDPNDAAVASMPTSAVIEVGADHIAPAKELGPLLSRLVRAPIDVRAVAQSTAASSRTEELHREVAMAKIDDDTHERRERYGAPSRFACPDCNGTLWDTTNGRGPLRLRCTVGHAYSTAGLAEAQNEQVERAFWTALRALEEKAELAQVRAGHATASGLTALAMQYQAQAETALAQAAAVRPLLQMDTPAASDAKTEEEAVIAEDVGRERKPTRNRPEHSAERAP